MVVTLYSVLVFYLQDLCIFRISVCGFEMCHRFTVDSKINREYRRFSAAGTQLSARLLPSPPNSNPVTHFLDSMSDLFENALRNCIESDMVGVTISNEVNMQDKPIGLSFRRKDQISERVIWSMFEKVSQANIRFNAMESLVAVVHSVRMHVGFVRTALRTKGRQLANMAHLKRSNIEVKAENICFAHALIFAIARMNKDPNYESYGIGYKNTSCSCIVTGDNRHRLRKWWWNPPTHHISGKHS